MRRSLGALILASVLLAAAAHGQTFPQPDYFRHLFARPAGTVHLPGSEGFSDYLAAHALRLSLEDAIRLALLNNTELQADRTDYEATQFALLRVHQPFDPVLRSVFQPSRSNSPSTSQLDGARTLTQLSHQAEVSYTQAFQTGTSYSVGFSTRRLATNSSYATVNPALSSNLNFSVTQSLLRQRGLLANRAPIILAQRGRKQSRANFEAQVNDIIARTVNQYWDVVEAREGLNVLRKSLELAEATYKQNRRALELGALPQLDIYRSESQVAQRKLAVIQSEARIKQLEDEMRRTIGADLDENLQALELDLTEHADTAALRPVAVSEAVQQAMAHRPELEAIRLQIENGDTSIRAANQNLKPDMNLTAFYSMNGSSGNFGDAWSQISGFDYPRYGATLEFRLPIRNSAAMADLGTALTAQKRNLYTLRQRQQAITLEVRNAVHQLEGSSQAIDAARTALDLARKNLAAEQRKYELGAQTIFFVLDAQTQLTQAEQSLVQAQIAYQRALTALDRATGDLLDRHRVQLEELK